MSFGVSVQASVCLTGWHGCRGSAVTDERPSTKGGRRRTLPQGSAPLSTVICSTHLLRPVLWLDCARKEDKELKRNYEKQVFTSDTHLSYSPTINDSNGRTGEAFSRNISTNDAEQWLTKMARYFQLSIYIIRKQLHFWILPFHQGPALFRAAVSSKAVIYPSFLGFLLLPW